MTKEEALNILIKDKDVDTKKISDGYHTFGELYEHRCVLFFSLCVYLYRDHFVWRSKKHSDGSQYEGWFIMGIGTAAHQQISYHLPEKYWANTLFANTLERAPEWDGHTSDDVIERIKHLK